MSQPVKNWLKPTKTELAGILSGNGMRFRLNGVAGLSGDLRSNCYVDPCVFHLMYHCAGFLQSQSQKNLILRAIWEAVLVCIILAVAIHEFGDSFFGPLSFFADEVANGV